MRELSANDLKQSGKFAKIAKMFHYIYSVRRNPNTDTSDYQGLGTPDKRSYEREDLVFDPLHCLPLIERKVGALDQAAPLRGWICPRPSPPCDASWKPVWAPGITVQPASASTSRSCVSWRRNFEPRRSRFGKARAWPPDLSSELAKL